MAQPPSVEFLCIRTAFELSFTSCFRSFGRLIHFSDCFLSSSPSKFLESPKVFSQASRSETTLRTFARRTNTLIPHSRLMFSPFRAYISLLPSCSETLKTGEKFSWFCHEEPNWRWVQFASGRLQLWFYSLLAIPSSSGALNFLLPLIWDLVKV